jgi:hypothetical protein
VNTEPSIAYTGSLSVIIPPPADTVGCNMVLKLRNNGVGVSDFTYVNDVLTVPQRQNYHYWFEIEGFVEIDSDIWEIKECGLTSWSE